MGSSVKWTRERYDSVKEWQRKNGATDAETQAHFKIASSSWNWIKTKFDGHIPEKKKKSHIAKKPKFIDLPSQVSHTVVTRNQEFVIITTTSSLASVLRSLTEGDAQWK